MEIGHFITSPPTDHTSILCKSCKARVFSKEAWQRFWAQPLQGHDYVVTREELLVGKRVRCWLCIYLRNKSTLRRFDVTIQFIFPEGVQPRKFHEMQIHLLPSETSNMKKIIRSGLSSTFDSVASGYFRAPHQHKTMSLGSFDKDSAWDWITQCQNSHEECQKLGQFKDQNQAPTRLLNVALSDTSFMKLELVPASTHIQYTALSYCWGTCDNFVSTTLTLETHQKQINIFDSPKTIQDAVRVTQMMGIKYIWIDAICILQDSAEDTRRELARMGSYYRNALFVIAASSARNVSEGFLGNRQFGTPFYAILDRRETRQEQTVVAPIYTPSGDKDKITIKLDSESYDPKTEPLEERAWAYQERLLCPRVLHFTSVGGFYLHCNKEVRHNDTIQFGRVAERLFSLDPSIRPHLENRGQSTLFHEAWLMHVRFYSGRLLTKQNDKFIAIAGIAEAYSCREGSPLGDYQAGHWSNFLIESLNWRVYGSQLQTACTVKRSPSWSWLSVDSPVIPVSGVLFGLHFRTLIDLRFSGVKLVHEELPFGPVEVGCLSMRANIGKAIWCPDSSRIYHSSLRLGDEASRECALATADTVKVFPASPIEVYFMPTCEVGLGFEVYGLILQRVAPSYEHLFYRIGYFERAPKAFLEACSPPMLASII